MSRHLSMIEFNFTKSIYRTPFIILLPDGILHVDVVSHHYSIISCILDSSTPCRDPELLTHDPG